MTVSIIVITYKRPDDVRRMLANALTLQPVPLEIIVLDNDPDGSARVAMPDSPLVRYLCIGENAGVAKGRNRAAAEARGEILFFVDDDAQIKDPASLVTLNQAFTEFPNVAVIACRVRNGYTGEIVHKEYPGRDARRSGEPHPVAYFVGCGFAVRRAIFAEFGGFDETFFFDGEELDFSWRLVKAGWELYYLPDVEVLHFTSPAGRGQSGSARWMARNRLYSALKHLPWPYLPVYITVWVGFAFLLALRKRDLRGWYEGLSSLRREGLIRRALAYRRTAPANRDAMDWMRRHEGRLWY